MRALEQWLAFKSLREKNPHLMIKGWQAKQQNKKLGALRDRIMKTSNDNFDRFIKTAKKTGDVGAYN